jgi:hypothetical protein
VKPLDPPDTIDGDPKATEMLRLWAAHNALQVSINIGCYEESEHDEAHAWGVILADCAKHVVNALSQRYEEDPDDALARIRTAFLAEVDHPTQKVTGR